MATLDYVKGKLRDAWEDWEILHVVPMCLEYAKASNRFKGIIEEQERLDAIGRERWASIAMIALAVAGGSVLTYLYGNAALSVAVGKTLKSAAGKTAKYTFSNGQFHRAFTLTHFVEHSPTAQFMLGKPIDGAIGMLGSELKQSLTEKKGNYSSLESFDTDPFVAYLSIKLFLDEAYHKTRTIAESAARIGGVIADLAFDGILNSAFVRKVPKKKIETTNLESQFLLTMCMSHVMDQDYTLSTEYGPGSPWGKHKTAPLSSLPSTHPDKDRWEWKQDGKKHVVQVLYNDLGDHVKSETNKVHKLLFGSDFFPRNDQILHDYYEVSIHTLRRAERVLSALGDANLKKMQNTLSGTVN